MRGVALARIPRLLFDAVDYRPATVPAVGRRRMVVAIGASALAHAIVLMAALLLVRPSVVEQPVIVLPVSLVPRPGAPGGGGGGGDTSVAEPAPPPPPAPEPPPRAAEPPRPVEKPTPTPAPVARRKPAAKAKPAAEPAASNDVANPSTGTGEGDVASRGGGGGGPGSGGGGGGGGTSASPAYGSNPQPPYPMAARRLGLEGTVVLRVVVGADGRPMSVSVLQSSGHEVLDASALETVRARWRFVPARRNGIPIEDSVQVPIRFHQTAG